MSIEEILGKSDKMAVIDRAGNSCLFVHVLIDTSSLVTKRQERVVFLVQFAQFAFIEKKAS